MTLTVAQVGQSVRVVAQTDGLWFRCDHDTNLATMDGWPADALAARAGRATAIELEQLLEQGLAETQDGQVRIPYACFAQLHRLEYRSTMRWTDWSPFLLSIAPIGDLGREDFHYRYRFHLGATEVSLRRVGYFVQRQAHEELYHLDDQTFALVEAMDRYNALPVASKTNRENWVTFALIKDCASSVGAALDKLLQSNAVVVPSRVGVRIIEHEDGSISFVPRCENVPEEGFRNAFLARPHAEGVYSVDRHGGGRLRVVLDDEQQEVLARMKRLQRLRGAAKQDAIKNPAQFFDGLLGRIDLPYGRRVEGIGEFPFAPMPRGTLIRSGVFDGVERAVAVEEGTSPASGEPSPNDDRPTSIQCKNAERTGDVRIHFSNAAAREEFRERVQDGLASGAESITHGGLQVAIDDELAASLSRGPADRQWANKGRSGKYLLIYTDEEDLRAWDEEIIRRICEPTAKDHAMEPPVSLDTGMVLKPHQVDGVRWLQHCARLQPDRRGCLLADDMGLGKTLQILTYLAWVIEQGKITAPGGDRDTGPYRPILIIAPLILLEAGTWRAEMERFFRHGGAIFEPVKVLHGMTINEVREDRGGREADIGAPTLAATKLMRYRVIITNYETVKNYQHSFAQMVEGLPLWSVVITDEAQEYKAPNTKISHAVKALQPDFHVACTGTPVENRLLDVWNIVDALQPALLGTAKDFTAQYEMTPDASAATEISPLRERLLFDAPNAFVMRRDKSMLPDLPKKTTERLYCDMADHEVRLHSALVAGLRGAAKGANHLGVLHRLSSLYQHPSLLDDTWVRKNSRELQAESAKLRRVIQQLHAIREHGEKALIFARLVDMQQLLAAVLREEFQLRVQIINGTTPRDNHAKSTATTQRAKDTRSQMLQDFRDKPGFHALILSPFVAGVGLTLTEANHVIHYGRWWNPAVESQATDRVYRIGQSKDVTVYLPILRDPQRRIDASFDECLDTMLQKKEVLARDFLQPMQGEDTMAEELRQNLVGSDQTPPRVLDHKGIQQLSPSDFEALVACLYRHKRYQVVLTSLSSDGGADVVAVRPEEVILIQTKHSTKSNPVPPTAVHDILGAQNIYQTKIPRTLRLHVVTNAHFDTACATQARQHGITLIDATQLRTMISAAGTTLGDIAATNAGRATSFADGLRKIQALL
jgi:superfamily II DNA or RNA helicase